MEEITFEIHVEGLENSSFQLQIEWVRDREIERGSEINSERKKERQAWMRRIKYLQIVNNIMKAEVRMALGTCMYVFICIFRYRCVYLHVYVY